MRKGLDGAHKRRVKERQGDHGERNVIEEENRGKHKKVGCERRFCRRGRKEEDHEEGMRWCT